MNLMINEKQFSVCFFQRTIFHISAVRLKCHVIAYIVFNELGIKNKCVRDLCGGENDF
jgi:hypothetical protein